MTCYDCHNPSYPVTNWLQDQSHYTGHISRNILVDSNKSLIGQGQQYRPYVKGISSSPNLRETLLSSFCLPQIKNNLVLVLVQPNSCTIRVNFGVVPLHFSWNSILSLSILSFVFGLFHRVQLKVLILFLLQRIETHSANWYQSQSFFYEFILYCISRLLCICYFWLVY